VSALWKILRVLSWLLSVSVLSWLALCGYVLWKRPVLLRKAGLAMSKRFGANGGWSTLDISFFRDFPNITFHSSNVFLRDNLWKQHHHNLLEAKQLFLRCTPFSLFSDQLQVSKIFLEQGSVNIFHDSTGYGNTDLLKCFFHTEDDDAGIPGLSLEGIRLIIEKTDTTGRRQMFDLDIRQLGCSVKKTGRSLVLRVNSVVRVNNIVFHAQKRSAFDGKDISSQGILQYNTASKILEGKQMRLYMDGQDWLVAGRFFSDVHPDPFLLTIQAAGIPFGDAIGFFPAQVRNQLSEYDMRPTVSLKIVLDAGAADSPDPLMTASLTVDDNEGIPQETPFGGVTTGLHIRYKGPLTISDSLPFLGRQTLDIDSLRWAPFRKALKK
jgi:hypothetical protein